MKKIVIIALLLGGQHVWAQFGVSYHQADRSFVGFNYEIADRFLPELRLGMNNYLDDMSVEAVATYQFLDKPHYEFYAGLGGRAVQRSGLVAPVGLHVFPFASRNFGFHLEIAPVFSENDPWIRGSWGIRYRFARAGK